MSLTREAGVTERKEQMKSHDGPAVLNVSIRAWCEPGRDDNSIACGSSVTLLERFSPCPRLSSQQSSPLSPKHDVAPCERDGTGSGAAVPHTFSGTACNDRASCTGSDGGGITLLAKPCAAARTFWPGDASLCRALLDQLQRSVGTNGSAPGSSSAAAVAANAAHVGCAHDDDVLGPFGLHIVLAAQNECSGSRAVAVACTVADAPAAGGDVAAVPRRRAAAAAAAVAAAPESIAVAVRAIAAAAAIATLDGTGAEQRQRCDDVLRAVARPRPQLQAYA